MSEKKFSAITVILAYYNTATKVAASLTGQVFGPATFIMQHPPKPKMARPKLILAPFIFLSH